MTQAPPPPLRRLARAPRIEWPTAAVLCAMLASLVAVWALASPEQRSDMLTGVAAVGGVALALMRAMLRAHDEANPPPPPSHANGRDTHPPSSLIGTPPPKRRQTMYERVAVGAALLMFTGCGASGLRLHAAAADVTGRILDVTCGEVEAARTHELLELPPTREDAHAAIDATIEQWAPMVASCNAIAEAHGAWADVIVRGVSATFDVNLALALALRIGTAWPDLTALLARVHVALPPLPAELGALALGGGS